LVKIYLLELKSNPSQVSDYQVNSLSQTEYYRHGLKALNELKELDLNKINRVCIYRGDLTKRYLKYKTILNSFMIDLGNV
jgi:hypothetical protein